MSCKILEALSILGNSDARVVSNNKLERLLAVKDKTIEELLQKYANLEKVTTDERTKQDQTVLRLNGLLNRANTELKRAKADNSILKTAIQETGTNPGRVLLEHQFNESIKTG